MKQNREDTLQYHSLGKGTTELQSLMTSSDVGTVKKYSRLVLGRDSLVALLKYELITGLFGNLPGAMGLVLRRFFYRFLFGRVGKGVIIGKGVVLRHPEKIIVGNHVAIDDNCLLDARGDPESGIIIEDEVVIARNSILRTKNGTIILGKQVNIGSNSILTSSSRLVIEESTLVAAFGYIIAGGQHVFDRSDIPIMCQGMKSRGGIHIGKNSWLGGRVTVLDGVTIGRDAIIGNSSLVTKDIPEYTVSFGIPAHVQKSRKIDHPP